MNRVVSKEDEYIACLQSPQKEAFVKLYRALANNIPAGFKACMQYHMPSFVVPFEVYPEGYHATANTPLPFISLAAQKNHIALYHMALYCHTELKEWLVKEYPKHSKFALDMGKSCIRFKRYDAIPFALIEELASKLSPNDWVSAYEKSKTT